MEEREREVEKSETQQSEIESEMEDSEEEWACEIHEKGVLQFQIWEREEG